MHSVSELGAGLSTSKRVYDPLMIEPGDQAPDFELPDQDGRPVKLSDYRGSPVVVYFYPKADTRCRSQRLRKRGPRAAGRRLYLPVRTAVAAEFPRL